MAEPSRKQSRTGIKKWRRKEFRPIARGEFIAIYPSGERVESAIEIGRPYLDSIGDGGTCGRCPVALRGFQGRLPDVIGDDEFQALMLALLLVRSLLTDFVDQGGKFLGRGGNEEYELDLLELFSVFDRGWEQGSAQSDKE